ncbi:MAG: hypothetical protein ABEJ30_07500 [Halorientalis sp.]
MAERVDLVERSLTADTRGEFAARVDEQAAFLRTAIEEGDLDNEDFAVGLELEVYAVSEDGRLARLPEDAFGVANKELGLHNAELNTDPTPLTAEGLDLQAESLGLQWRRARDAAREAGRDLVLDAMWTVPPAEGSASYLSATEDRDGVTTPANMRPVPRYWAIDRDATRAAGGSITFDVPGATVAFPSMLFESLATSIQPHLQIPSTEAFPAHYNAAIRTLGPVLALATNSPFLPPDLYDADVDPRALLDRTHHELRIAAFEQSVNHTDPPKCRVPEDVDAPADLVDQVVADPVVAPFLSEWVDEDAGYAANFWEFDHKRGTFWRWLRPVVGGDPVEGAGDERSLRIEYRPLPTQPTVRDIVGFQALVGGLVVGLVAADHPLPDLEWGAAERSFYAAVENGLDAELAWLTADGERTADPAVVFGEVFEYARLGLREQGVDDATARHYLAPIEARWQTRTTPSKWKIARVRDALDEGLAFPDALEAMQREYVRRSRTSESFADWL